MSNIIILFGEMGGGKNYHGEALAQKLGYTFLDGDTVAQPEMIEKVSNFKPLTKDIIKQFIGRLVAKISLEAVSLEATASTGLIIAQALYRDTDRWFIKWLLNRMGHNVKFIWIKTPFIRNFKQIYSRPKGFRWVLYWLMNKPFFQKPTHDHEVM